MITIKRNKFFLNGKRQEFLTGVLAGKMAARVALKQFSKVESFINFCQEWLKREVLFYTWLETGGWDPRPTDQAMFGAPPRDPGMWNVNLIRSLWNGDEVKRIKPEHLTKLYKDTLEWFFKNSERLGCSFMLGIIATLKHTDGVGNGHLDHAIARTLELAEELQDKYPKANVIMHACNEADANDQRNTPAGKERIKWNTRSSKGMHMWAQRRADQHYFNSDENLLLVDHGGRDTFEYPCSRSKSTFDAASIHPVRKNAGRDWKKPPKRRPLIELANGMPLFNTENMYMNTRPETANSQWYRNEAGYNLSVEDQVEMYSHWEEFYDAANFHADWIMQTDENWPGSKLERYLKMTAEIFGGSSPPPLGVDPLGEHRPYIRHIYLHYYGRDPINELKWPDPTSGLESYNTKINNGDIEIWELPYVLCQDKEGKNKLK